MLTGIFFFVCETIQIERIPGKIVIHTFCAFVLYIRQNHNYKSAELFDTVYDPVQVICILYIFALLVRFRLIVYRLFETIHDGTKLFYAIRYILICFAPFHLLSEA